MSEIPVSGTIRCLSEFSETMSRQYLRKQRGHWVFRGQSSDAFLLLPKVARVDHTSATREKFESSLFSLFKRSAVQYLERLPGNDWEWLALAQHHGLPTRLLDWSYNPLVSLYFAVEMGDDTDGAVYALHAPKQIPKEWLKSPGAKSPFEMVKPMKFLPNVVATRVWVQEGLFTVHARLDEPLTSETRADWKLERILIPKECKRRIRYELYRHGVHRASLFPDLDGLAAQLQWQHGVTPDQIFEP